MEDLSIYHDRDNGVIFEERRTVGRALSIGLEDPKDFVFQEFTRDQTIQMRDWLSELIEETAPPPPPNNADIIEALTPGSVFTLVDAYDGRRATWFRLPLEVVRANNPANRTSDFNGWIGDHIRVEVNYTHKEEN